MTSLRRELLIALALGGALWLVTLVPYLAGYLDAPGGHVFNGFFYLADDATTYVSKMREGAEGAWGWSDRYISTPQAQPVLVFLFYVLWGKLAALLHLSLYTTYHLARLSGAVALVAAARALARRALPDAASRHLALALALLGSGAGYLALLAHSPRILGEQLQALDLHLPELSGLYSVLAIPHFAWSAALMAWGLLALMDVAATEAWRDLWRPALRAVLVLAALCAIHPQMLVVLAALALAFLLLRGTAPLALGRLQPAPVGWLGTALVFLLMAPLLAYYWRVLTGDPVIAAWSRQWRHQAPGPLSLLLAMGLPLALAAYGALRGPDRARPEQRVLVAWLLLVALLLYLPNPVNIQRRLLDGIYLPTAVLAAAGVAALARRRGAAQVRPVARFALAAVASLSSLVVLGIGLDWALTRQPFLYLDRDADAAMTAMALTPHNFCDPPAVLTVASPLLDPAFFPDDGLFIPARAGYRVVVGHYSETLDYAARAREAVAVMRAGGPVLVAWMRSNDAELLWIGPAARYAGVADPDPGWFEPAFTAGQVRVYRLRYTEHRLFIGGGPLSAGCDLAAEPLPGG